MRRLAAFQLLLCVTLPAQRTDPDWPGWGGPNRDAISHETGLLKKWPDGGPALAWQAAGMGIGFSGIAIVGNRIYTMGDLPARGDRSDGQYVLALNLADGKPVWATKIGPVWDDEYGGPRGTPAVDGDSVYAIGTEGEVVALDSTNGNIRWKKSMVVDYNGQI